MKKYMAVVYYRWGITDPFDNSPEMWMKVKAYYEMCYWWRRIKAL